ncbi:hypothetical protein ABT294_05155 [Nonomuraea sp. NPDC000554]|uniref:WXG100 family type VII secretion target n=1 Tax=Nonomuraea sp. NPDC000554 TaxID=3154259 RepID=UPI00331D644C
MGDKRKVVVIYSFEALPQGAEVKASKKEIEQMLANTKPTEIDDAGFAYLNVAGTIDLAVGALEKHASRLAKDWKGPTAAKVQKAMQMMHASGTELASKMKLMDGALRLYSEELRKALEEVKGISVDFGDDIENSPETKAAAKKAKASAEDAQAQKVMKKLNERIAELFQNNVPGDVSYELPPVGIPGEGSPKGKPVNYDAISSDKDSSRGGSNNPTPYERSTRDGGSSGGHGTTGHGSGSDRDSTPSGGDKNPDGRGSDSTGSDGRGSDGTGSDRPGTDGQDGKGQDGTGSDHTPADGTNQNTGNTQDQQNGSDRGRDTGSTVPSVIGKDDPRQTEVANFSPHQPTTTPFTTTSIPTTTIPTTTIPATTGLTPGVPSVLGAPGGFAAGPMGGASVSGMPATAGTGMLPLGAMGGAGAGSEEGVEHGTDLSEERDVWASPHQVTDPRIG